MIILIVAFFICLMIIIYYILSDKIKIFNNKFNIINEKINSTLLKRKELLQDAENTIKEVLDTNKKIFENLDYSNDISITEIDSKLNISVNELELIKSKYEKLNKNENFKKICFSIEETTDLLKSYKTYYNNTSKDYKKFIKSFPMCIISIFKRKKEIVFFDN